MSLKAYKAILSKVGVDAFYGNEQKIRQYVLQASATELMREIDVNRGTVTGLFSILLDEPTSPKQNLFLRRLYESSAPVNYEELCVGLSQLSVSTEVLEKMRVLKSYKHKKKQIITEINKPVIRRYWPKIVTNNFLDMRKGSVLTVMKSIGSHRDMGK